MSFSEKGEKRLVKSYDEQEIEIDINGSNSNVILNPSRDLLSITDNGEGTSSNTISVNSISDNKNRVINTHIVNTNESISINNDQIKQKRKSYQIRALVCINRKFSLKKLLLTDLFYRLEKLFHIKRDKNLQIFVALHFVPY
jgi:hypothetical protein